MLLMSGYLAMSKDDMPAALGRFEAGYYFGCGICAYALASNMINNPAYQRQRGPGDSLDGHRRTDRHR